MKKIPTVFVRDQTTKRVINEINPGCEWVAEGFGIATRKFDGTCCMIKDGKLFKRYDAKQGKTPPDGFIPAQEPDAITGHWPGWLLVGEGPEDRWFREAWKSADYTKSIGTWELVGPKINGNPEKLDRHLLICHGVDGMMDSPRDYTGLYDYLQVRAVEGIVWHHADGRMAKIQRKDFGLKWPA